MSTEVSQSISARRQFISFGIVLQNSGVSVLGGRLFTGRFVKVERKAKIRFS